MNDKLETNFEVRYGDNKRIVIPKNFVFGINFFISIIGVAIFFHFFPTYVKNMNDIPINQTMKTLLIITPALTLFFLLLVMGFYFLTIVIMIIKGKIKHSDL